MSVSFNDDIIIYSFHLEAQSKPKLLVFTIRMMFHHKSSHCTVTA